MKKRTKIICAIAAIAVIIAVMAGVYLQFGPKAQEGAKAVTIEVVDDKGDSTKYDVNTDAKYLSEVMEEAEDDGLTFSGTTGEYGLNIDTVNDLKADYNADGAYWAIYVNGEYGQYGADQQPVADGDTFKLEYTVWTE